MLTTAATRFSLNEGPDKLWVSPLTAPGAAMDVDIFAVHVTKEEHLESLLQCRLGNLVRDLRVQLSPAGLIIQGRAATYHAKQLAQHAAMELADVPIAANDIEVF
jgi:hypothetical protein